MWVRLCVNKMLNISGKSKLHYAGEWVYVPNRQTVEAWIAAGDAARPDQVDLELMSGCGIESPIDGMKSLFKEAAFERTAVPRFSFPRTLWLQDPVGSDLMAAGFALLDRWDIVAPIASYDVLADSLTGAAEYEKELRDLRVPFYSTKNLWYRDNDVTRKLMAEWLGGGNESDNVNNPLQLLLALYRIKPLLLAVPPHWGGKA